MNMTPVRWSYVRASLIALVGCVLIYFAKRAIWIDGGRRQDVQVENALRAIMGAKYMHASARHLPLGTTVTADEVAVHLHGSTVERLRGGSVARFHVNPIGIPPEAVLMRAAGPYPAGTIIRAPGEQDQEGKFRISIPDF